MSSIKASIYLLRDTWRFMYKRTHCFGELARELTRGLTRELTRGLTRAKQGADSSFGEV